MDVVSPTEAALTIVEGRYHQVRRMFAATGNHVVALHRERIGDLELSGNLPPGGFKVLGADEIALIFSAAAGPATA
jgi:16S rRNA pseudouridine516 synthase